MMLAKEDGLCEGSVSWGVAALLGGVSCSERLMDRLQAPSTWNIAWNNSWVIFLAYQWVDACLYGGMAHKQGAQRQKCRPRETCFL